MMLLETGMKEEVWASRGCRWVWGGFPRMERKLTKKNCLSNSANSKLFRAIAVMGASMTSVGEPLNPKTVKNINTCLLEGP